MAIECTANELADLSSCFTGLSPRQQAAIMTYLLCQIANNGGGGGGGEVLSGNGAPVAAPAQSVAIYFDVLTGTQYNYYSGAWH